VIAKLTLLHLGDEFLVEETAGALVQRAVDGDNIALGKHLLEVVNTAAANLLLNLGPKGLVVVVEQLLAVEGLETAQHTFTDTTNGDGSDDLVLEVKLVLGDGSNIPFPVADLLVGGDEVANQSQNGHDNVLGDRDNIATSDFGDSDTAVGLVGSIEVNVVGTDTGSDGELQILGLGQALCGEITGVETITDSQ
jgi:hypothetical protein